MEMRWNGDDLERECKCAERTRVRDKREETLEVVRCKDMMEVAKEEDFARHVEWGNGLRWKRRKQRVVCVVYTCSEQER